MLILFLRLLHRVRGGFPLNYGREAVCELINKPEKELFHLFDLSTLSRFGWRFPGTFQTFRMILCSNKHRYSNFIDENLQGDWKTCVVSDEQEEHYAGKFREIFEKFDPFLNADSDDTDVEDEIDGAPSREAIEA